MHRNNLLFLNETRATYPEAFIGSTLELGSGGGSQARQWFSGPYIGIDLVDGPGVDKVCAAKDTQFEPGQFETLICLSMFEHDPRWALSLRHNLQWIRSGGLVILCWGAEGNLHHGPEPWKPVRVANFKRQARKMPLLIIEAFFEEQRYGLDCAGAYDVLARKL